MTARVGRLAGALLLHSHDAYYLIGNLKEPCDFSAAGFEPPAIEINGIDPAYVRLRATGPVRLSQPALMLDLAGEDAAVVLAERMVIKRNGLVSERLWELVLQPEPEQPLPTASEVDARWLGQVPTPIWDIVRERMLRCI